MSVSPSESGIHRWAVQSETHKTPSMLQACSFISNSFLEFCISTHETQTLGDWTPAFSLTIFFPQVYSSIWQIDTLKFPVNCFGTVTLDWKRWFACAFCKHFFFHYAKLMPSLNINLTLAGYYRQAHPWEGLNKPGSSSSGHFTLCPPLPVSSAWFFCKAFSLISVCYSSHTNSSLPFVFEC